MDEVREAALFYIWGGKRLIFSKQVKTYNWKYKNAPVNMRADTSINGKIINKVSKYLSNWQEKKVYNSDYTWAETIYNEKSY